MGLTFTKNANRYTGEFKSQVHHEYQHKWLSEVSDHGAFSYSMIKPFCYKCKIFVGYSLKVCPF